MIREFIYENLQSDKVAMIEITDENGNATQMLKSTYDEQQAALSTPMISGDE